MTRHALTTSQAARYTHDGTMKRFRVWRPNPPGHYIAQGHANQPDQPQFEGVIFTDGTVAVRWLTQFRSTSVWASFAELWAVHGHHEYGTQIEWW